MFGPLAWPKTNQGSLKQERGEGIIENHAPKALFLIEGRVHVP